MYQADANRGTNEEREQEQASPSSLPNLNCGLELLPTEVLVAILSAARSTTDLHALIRASPRLYQVFVPAKREVLLSIVATDLGDALRDALAVLLIAPPKLDPRKPTYLEECEHVIRRYAALPHSGADGGLASAARALPTDAIIALSHLNRTVQFLVDEYARTRLPELHKVDPATAGPLTAAERRRVAGALLRHQVLARIDHGQGRPRVEQGQHLARETAVMHQFLGLFRPWETEQLAEVNSFLCGRAHCAFPPPLGIRESCVRQPLWERRREAAMHDLRLLHRGLLELQARVATDSFEAARARRPAWAEMVVVPSFPFLRAGPLPDQASVLCYVAPEHRGLRDELYRREDAMPPLELTENDDDTAPPFAWADAHNKLNCQRWGGHLCREVLREGQEDTTPHQGAWVRDKLDTWRWLGFVFWDRARVELLKTRMPVYETGWLRAAPPSQEELYEAYQKKRVLASQVTRRNRRGGKAIRGGEAMR